jgi:threonylcarbamoyladenosine tRNA methylthiotransferase MtaB
MKVYLDTVGCRLNQAEIERLASQFRSAGHTIVDGAQGADLVVINTCTVTAAAASDSREKARQAHAAGAGQIVLTGCWATLDPESAASLPGVMRIVKNEHKNDLLPELLGIPALEPASTTIAREPLPGIHHRTRAFIKVQDGCDNFCTFCVTRIARGRGVSVPEEQVMREIKAAVEGGAKEAVLSGVHLGSWGRDLNHSQHLRDLIQSILTQTQIHRLRLSSIEPWDLDASFFDLWQDPRMCRQIHFPLQSGSATVLKRMARNTTPERYRELVEIASETVPDLALTTDIIVGFPQETDEEFTESLEFVKEMKFAGGHVFKYSPRPGTAAAKLPGRVHGKIAHSRSQQLRALLQQSAREYAARFEGQVLEVLWESSLPQGDGSWKLSGLTGNNLRAVATLPENRVNQLDRVHIHQVVEDHLEVSVV